MVNGTWISNLLEGTWWLILLIVANGVFLLFHTERKRHKKDVFKRITYNPRYAIRCGIDAELVSKGRLPSMSLFEFYQLAKRCLPEYNVRLRQHHLLIRHEGKTVFVLMLDNTIRPGVRYFGEVIAVNYTTVPDKKQLIHDVKVAFATDDG